MEKLILVLLVSCTPEVVEPPVSEPLPPPEYAPRDSGVAPVENKVVPDAAGDVFSESQVNGRLAPELIQKNVRVHFGRFRLCYEAGLRRNSRLQGRVAIKFVIGLDGRVTIAQDGGSDIPDPEVVACVVDGFRSLQFDNPEGGIVTVVYPIIFNPGD